MPVNRISGQVNNYPAVPLSLAAGEYLMLPVGQGIIGSYGGVSSPQLGTGNPLTGQYLVDLGMYSCLQVYDQGLQYWKTVATGNPNHPPMGIFSSDGANYRIANTTGCPVGAIITSAGTAALGWSGVATVGELSAIPRSLPVPVAPVLRLVPPLIIPALSLAFVGLVQGAAISAAFPNPDGRSPDSSRDFIGQGAANVIAGVFRGMPVGGSMSATSLNKAAGARSRLSLVIAGVVMAVVILAFAGLVGHIAMPALAGLLILVGFRTIKPDDLASVWKTGPVQKLVLGTSFVLTMLIPLQYAVLAGVGLSMILHVIRQSNQVTIKRQVPGPDGTLTETDPPAELPAGEVVVLQPYGSLFFAAAPVFESQLPTVASTSGNSVVILRLRGRTDLGTTFMQVLCRYAAALGDAGSRLMLVSASKQIQDQLHTAGVTDVIGAEAIYTGDERVGATLSRACVEATAWIESGQGGAGTGTRSGTEPP